MSANPTIANPITEPARKAIRKAGLSPSCAAVAVRTLALTATVIPMYPAMAEDSEPNTKATAVMMP